MAFPKFEIVLLLLVVFRLGQSVSPYDKISKFFPKYRNFERLLWRKLSSYFPGANSKQRLLQHVLDYHKTYLSRHPLVNLPPLRNKVNRQANWKSFNMKMQSINHHFKNFRTSLRLNEEIDFTNALIRELSFSMLNSADVFLNSIKNATALLANFKGKTVRRKCSLTSEYMQWQSLFYKVYATLLRTYILTEYAWMYKAIEQNGINYLIDRQLREKFREVEDDIRNNFSIRFQNISNHAIMRCPVKKVPWRVYHNVTFPAKFSLREVTSDIERNMVIVGFRFQKQEHQNFYHLQIKEGRLGPDGTIVNGTAIWKPIVNLPDIDYLPLTENDTFESEIRHERPFVVTGLKLNYNRYNHSEQKHESGLLSFMVRFNEIDIEKRKVFKNATDNWVQANVTDRNIKFENNFYLDKRPIRFNLLTPLSGAGISCDLRSNHSKDVLCYPKIFAFMP